MQIQVITFRLNGITRADYDALCQEAAPAYAATPGLVSKVWLADESTNTYGGVYTWRDREAMEAFLKSELFRTVATHPRLARLSSRVFAVLAAPSRITSSTRGSPYQPDLCSGRDGAR